MSDPTGCLYCQGIEREKCLNCQTYNRLDEAKRLIKDLEWVGCDGQPVNFCPVCRRYEPWKEWETPHPGSAAGFHKPDCRLAILLDAATMESDSTEDEALI